ncbi:MAG: 50S ribosomal protein L25/general stress protein Ctc [Alphaproteobacteria bacterium]|nr:50S ribosomal protein L25/general stress protein Ctc [Alphaproteobacteria bacterium]
MKTTDLNVSLRKTAGKGAARLVRKEKSLPAVIYGDNKDSMSIKLDPKDLLKEMHKPGFTARLFKLKWDKGEQVSLCKKVDFDPVSGVPIHADFLRVGTKALRVSIALHFTNREASPGLKQGGILNTLRRKLTVFCKPDSIPDFINISLEGLTFGDSVHVKDIILPEGVSLADDRVNFSIAAIVAPRVSGKGSSETEGEEGTEEGAEASADADSKE